MTEDIERSKTMDHLEMDPITEKEIRASTHPAMPKTPRRVITIEALQEVVNYLSKQPFGEVHQLIQLLLQLPAEQPRE